MAYSCDDNYEEASLQSEAFAGLSFLTTESATALGYENESSFSFTTETANLDDLSSFEPAQYVYETALLNDSVAFASNAVSDLFEEATLNGAFVPRFITSIDEQATLDDLVPFRSSANINEVVTGVGAAVSANLVEQLVYETASALGAYVGGSTSAVNEQAALDDLVTQTGRVTNNVVESATLDDTLDTLLALTDEVVEQGVLDDLTVQTVAAVNATVEMVYGTGVAIPPAVFTAWVTHTKQWAMSRYTGLQSGEMVSRGTKVLGASSDGVFSVQRDQPVTSYVLTGKFDNGSQQLKRMESMYAAGEAESPLQLTTITSDDAGNEVEYEYAFEPRSMSTTRTNRAIVGKGLRSRFWQFKFSNPDGAYFALRDGKALMAVTGRRV